MWSLKTRLSFSRFGTSHWLSVDSLKLSMDFRIHSGKKLSDHKAWLSHTFWTHKVWSHLWGRCLRKAGMSWTRLTPWRIEWLTSYGMTSKPTASSQRLEHIGISVVCTNDRWTTWNSTVSHGKPPKRENQSYMKDFNFPRSAGTCRMQWDWRKGQVFLAAKPKQPKS